MSHASAWSADAAGAPLSDDEQILVSTSPQGGEVEQRLLQAPAVRGESKGYLLLLGATIIALVIVWWLIPVLGLMNPVLISTPVDTLQALWSLATGSLLTHFAFTMVQVVGGFFLGVSIGLLLGTALAVSPFLHRVFTPYVLALRSLPVIVLAPLFIAWFGFGVQSKIATAVTICFLPTMVNTMVGLRLPTEPELALMRALQASPWQVYRKLRIPCALPMIFVGLKHSLLLSFTGVLLAEILLGGSTTGLGTLVRQYSHQIRMDLVFAVVGVLTLLSVLLVMVFDRIDRRVVFWREQ